MKITHHLGRFATFFKQSSLVVQLVIVVSGIGIIAGTATVVAMVATPSSNEVSTNSTASESSDVASDTDNQPSTSNEDEQTTDSDTATVTPQANETTPQYNTQTAPQTSQPTTSQQTETNTNTTPRQTAPTPTAPTCNESMKSSYTSLYNSQVIQENLRYSREMDAIASEISRRNLHFSGIAQEMRDNARAPHEANLASIEAQYYLNLASINCDPRL